MKPLHLHPSSNTCSTATLQPGQPVHTLCVARGQSAELHTATGCAWITRDGALQDWLLPAGHRLSVQGPACLRLGSACAHRAAEVEWKKSLSQPLLQRLAAVWRRLHFWRPPVVAGAASISAMASAGTQQKPPRAV